MKIKNISPLGDLFTPALSRDVAAGEVVEIPDGLAALADGVNYEAVESKSSKEK